MTAASATIRALTTFFPEDLAREIVGMATFSTVKPHPFALAISALRFAWSGVPRYPVLHINGCCGMFRATVRTWFPFVLGPLEFKQDLRRQWYRRRYTKPLIRRLQKTLCRLHRARKWHTRGERGARKYYAKLQFVQQALADM